MVNIYKLSFFFPLAWLFSNWNSPFSNISTISLFLLHPSKKIHNCWKTKTKTLYQIFELYASFSCSRCNYPASSLHLGLGCSSGGWYGEAWCRFLSIFGRQKPFLPRLSWSMTDDLSTAMFWLFFVQSPFFQISSYSCLHSPQCLVHTEPTHFGKFLLGLTRLDPSIDTNPLSDILCSIHSFSVIHFVICANSVLLLSVFFSRSVNKK
jgi:hypothetical protein